MTSALRLIASSTGSDLVHLLVPTEQRLWWAANPLTVPAEALARLANRQPPSRGCGRRGDEPSRSRRDRDDRLVLAVCDAQGDLGWLTLCGCRVSEDEAVPLAWGSLGLTQFEHDAALDEGHENAHEQLVRLLRPSPPTE